LAGLASGQYGESRMCPAGVYTCVKWSAGRGSQQEHGGGQGGAHLQE